MKNLIAIAALVVAGIVHAEVSRQATEKWVLHKIDENVGTNTAALVAAASSAATNHAAGLCARTATSATNYTDAATNALDLALAPQIAAKYAKPTGGIPKTDLAAAVQTSLGRADTALQSYTETDPVWTAEKSDYLTAVAAAMAYKPIGWFPAWGDVTGKPQFAAVATSGAYGDLSGKPDIPATNGFVTAAITNGLANLADVAAVSNAAMNAISAGYISETNAPFVAAVLAVQVASLSTNITAEVYIAATNACANLGIDPSLIPGAGTTGTVGGFIVMLFAVVFWMRKKIFDHTSARNNPHGTSWTNLQGKPSTFPSSAHAHEWSDLPGVIRRVCSVNVDGNDVANAFPHANEISILRMAERTEAVPIVPGTLNVSQLHYLPGIMQYLPPEGYIDCPVYYDSVTHNDMGAYDEWLVSCMDYDGFRGTFEIKRYKAANENGEHRYRWRVIMYREMYSEYGGQAWPVGSLLFFRSSAWDTGDEWLEQWVDDTNTPVATLYVDGHMEYDRNDGMGPIPVSDWGAGGGIQYSWWHFTYSPSSPEQIILNETMYASNIYFSASPQNSDTWDSLTQMHFAGWTLADVEARATGATAGTAARDVLDYIANNPPDFSLFYVDNLESPNYVIAANESGDWDFVGRDFGYYGDVGRVSMTKLSWTPGTDGRSASVLGLNPDYQYGMSTMYCEGAAILPCSVVYGEYKMIPHSGWHDFVPPSGPVQYDIHSPARMGNIMDPFALRVHASTTCENQPINVVDAYGTPCEICGAPGALDLVPNGEYILAFVPINGPGELARWYLRAERVYDITATAGNA